MTVCSRCVIPETFPGADLDGRGVCLQCREARGEEEMAGRRRDYRRRFRRLLETEAGRGPYDAIVAYSGGKDSTHTLALLVERYRLRALAATFDNGFLPEQTFRNIRAVTEALGVDHVLVKPSFPMLRTIFRSLAAADVFAPKALERASAICTACIGMVKFGLTRMAVEKGVPMVAFGWSPGQAPVESSIVKTNAPLLALTQKAILGPLREIAGDAVRPFFLEERHLRDAAALPTNVAPLLFSDYDEEAILRDIARLGWTAPAETDSNSTNCLLNSFANAVHRGRHGFHPYVFEMAGLVRRGALSRDEALERLERPESERTIAEVKLRLGLA